MTNGSRWTSSFAAQDRLNDADVIAEKGGSPGMASSLAQGSLLVTIKLASSTLMCLVQNQSFDYFEHKPLHTIKMRQTSTLVLLNGLSTFILAAESTRPRGVGPECLFYSPP